MNIPIVIAEEAIKKRDLIYKPDWWVHLSHHIHIIWSELRDIPWGIILISIVFSYGIGILCGWSVIKILRFLKKSKEKFVQPEYLKSLVRSARLVGSVLFFNELLSLFLKDSVEEELNDFLQSLEIICLTYFVISLWEVAIELFLNEENQRPKQINTLILPFIRKVVGVFIIGGGIIMVISINGINTSGVVTFFAFGGAALGIAGKDSLENFFGALSIVTDMPFGVGDCIKVNQFEGKVDQINIRSTRIRTPEDSLVTIPNSNFVRTSVENLGERRYIYYVMNFYTPTQTDPQVLIQYCRKAEQKIGELPRVNEKATYVYMIEINEKGIKINLETSFTAENYRKELECYEECVIILMKLAQEMNLNIVYYPFPLIS